MANDNKKKVPVVEDVLFHQKPDRRLLSYAPDVTGQRTNRDRRGRDSSIPGTSEGYIKLQQDDKNGQRYLVDYEGHPFDNACFRGACSAEGCAGHPPDL